MADNVVERLRDTAYETDVCWEAAAEIERLRALVEIGDQLVKSIRDHNLNGAVLRAWEQARRDR